MVGSLAVGGVAGLERLAGEGYELGEGGGLRCGKG